MHARGGEQKIVKVTDHMAGFAANLYSIGAVGDVVADTALRIKLFSLLIEVCNLQFGAARYRAARRLVLIEQELEQRTFAAAVGTNDCHPVAAQNSGTEILDNLLVVEPHT